MHLLIEQVRAGTAAAVHVIKRERVRPGAHLRRAARATGELACGESAHVRRGAQGAPAAGLA